MITGIIIPVGIYVWTSSPHLNIAMGCAATKPIPAGINDTLLVERSFNANWPLTNLLYLLPCQHNYLSLLIYAFVGQPVSAAIVS